MLEASGTILRMHFSFLPPHTLQSVSFCRCLQEQAKKREYSQRVCEVEHGVFTPLVLSSNGGMGKEATTFYKRLADMIAQKKPPLLNGNGMAEVQDILCHAQMLNHVHLWEQIFLPSPSQQLRHLTACHRGTHPPF